MADLAVGLLTRAKGCLQGTSEGKGIKTEPFTLLIQVTIAGALLTQQISGSRRRGLPCQ